MVSYACMHCRHPRGAPSVQDRTQRYSRGNVLDLLFDYILDVTSQCCVAREAAQYMHGLKPRQKCNVSKRTSPLIRDHPTELTQAQEASLCTEAVADAAVSHNAHFAILAFFAALPTTWWYRGRNKAQWQKRCEGTDRSVTLDLHARQRMATRKH